MHGGGGYEDMAVEEDDRRSDGGDSSGDGGGVDGGGDSADGGGRRSDSASRDSVLSESADLGAEDGDGGHGGDGDDDGARVGRAGASLLASSRAGRLARAPSSSGRRMGEKYDSAPSPSSAAGGGGGEGGGGTGGRRARGRSMECVGSMIEASERFASYRMYLSGILSSGRVSSQVSGSERQEGARKGQERKYA